MPAPTLSTRRARAGLAARGWIATTLVMVCSACAGLPKDVDRPVSNAIDVAQQPTALSALVAQRRAAAGARSASGFMLLSGPQDAYGSRLAMVQAAQKTLDLQYYAIHADASTARLLQGVVQAARRGVRVRILLDDFHSTGRNALVMGLAFEPHIEMRMFNPVAGTRASMLGRLWGSVTDFSRVQQRMHNKLFIADNVVGVTGGRNLGDSYFGQGTGENFVDMDVLAAGPIVADMSRSFDSYWNNPRSYPVQSLITREELERLRQQVDRKAQEEVQDANQDAAQAPQPPPLVTPKEAAKAAAAAARSSAKAGAAADLAPPPEAAHLDKAVQVWNQQPMNLQAVQWTWAPAAMLADKPTKVPLESDSLPAAAATSPSEADATPDAPLLRRDAPVSAAPGPAAAGARDAETVVDGLLQLMQLTQRELLIISPYFVPGDDMKRAFAEARARGVRVRILTNSLASNDAPIAHVGYARHRRELLEMGVELYELRSEQAGLRSAFGDSGAGASSGKGVAGSKSATGEDSTSGGAPGASRSMLHSKVLVSDRNLLVVGSMNLDLRSQLQNTEIALVIRSRKLSEQAAHQIDNAMRAGAWHIEQQPDGSGLVWRAPQGSDLPDATHDPDSSLWLRLMLRLLGPLAPDRLL